MLNSEFYGSEASSKWISVSTIHQDGWTIIHHRSVLSFSTVTQWSPGRRCSVWSSPVGSSSQQTCWVPTALWLVSGTSLASWRWWSPLTFKRWAICEWTQSVTKYEQKWRVVSVSGEQQHHPGSFGRLRRLPIPQTGHRTDGVSCCLKYLSEDLPWTLIIWPNFQMSQYNY